LKTSSATTTTTTTTTTTEEKEQGGDSDHRNKVYYRRHYGSEGKSGSFDNNNNNNNNNNTYDSDSSSWNSTRRSETMLPWNTGTELVILDFGMSAKLREEAREGFCELLLAIQDGVVERMLSALNKIGIRLNKISDKDADNIMTFLTHYYRDTAPAKENRAKFLEFVKAARKRREVEKKEGKKSQMFFEKVPVDWVYYNRTYSLLRGACCQLGARVPVLEIFSQAARRGLEISRRRKRLAPREEQERKMISEKEEGALINTNKPTIRTGGGRSIRLHAFVLTITMAALITVGILMIDKVVYRSFRIRVL